MSGKKPLISIIGRPNVGKSTLINRLAGSKACIVDDAPGITRDRHYIDIDWNGSALTLVDTGGLVFDENEDFAGEILEQANHSIKQSDAIILVVDAKTGVTNLDYQVAKYLRELNQSNGSLPLYVAVNKVDNQQREELIYEFYELGFDKVYPISALHGSQGLGDLLNSMVEEFSKKNKLTELDEEQEEIKVAVVGKPNVGKSSLFNKLVGDNRSIVSNISGTTRDAVDTVLNRHGNKFRLVDTAGMRRKAKIQKDTVERFANIRAIRSIEEADVVVMMLDGTAEEIVTEQDKKIVSLVLDRGKACIVLINKWDAVERKDDKKFLDEYKNRLDYELRFIRFAPKEFISALSGQRTDKIWEMIIAANEQHKRRIGTSLLNKIVTDITMVSPPPVVKQKALKIKYASQIGIAPPRFAFFVNDTSIVPETYKRFLEKQIREYFGFEATPLFIKFKSSNKD